MDLQIADLEGMKLTELYKLAKQYQIPYYGQLKKKELIFAILRAQAEQSGLMFMEGVLEILPEGYGFLRPINYLPSTEDIYISASQIRKFDLRTGTSSPGSAGLRKKMNGISDSFKSTPSTERIPPLPPNGCISRRLLRFIRRRSSCWKLPQPTYPPASWIYLPRSDLDNAV